MGVNIRDALNAGVVRQLCLYHYKNRDKDTDWIMTREYAVREHSYLTMDVIEQVINLCKMASHAASGHCTDLGCSDEYIESLKHIFKS